MRAFRRAITDPPSWSVVCLDRGSLADIEALQKKLYEVAVMVPQPEVHIRGDQESRYENVNKVVEACQRASIVKVGFILEPPPKG